MDLVDRIYRLYGLLRSARHPVPLARIRREFEDCSRSAAVRTIEHMRDHLHAPIDYDRGRNGYCLRQTEDGPWELPGLWFNASELHALLAVHQLLTGVQPGLLDEELAPLRGRIEQILKSRHAGGGEVARRVRVIRMAARTVEPAHFRQVAEAVLARKRLRIVYHGRERDATTAREVSPQRLVHYRDNWYCDAWDHAKRALRVFSLDCIRASRTLAKPAKEISESRLDAHFGSAYGIFAGIPRRKAVLRFTPERARWVADEIWHPRQQAQHLPGGGYLLSFPYADERELILDVLKYGPDVEVLSPPSLRQAVQARLRRALAQYTREKPKVRGAVGATSSKPLSRRTGARRAPPPGVRFAVASPSSTDWKDR